MLSVQYSQRSSSWCPQLYLVQELFFCTSLFQGGTQQESITVSGIKVWVHTTNTDGLAWGAAGVRNTGDKVLSVDKIQIRGTDIPFAQWYPDTDVTATLFSQALNHTGWLGGGLAPSVTNGCSGERIAINNGFGDICVVYTDTTF